MQTTSEPRYWAFISYSHHDAAVATRLQRDLEGYRVPARLVGRQTATGLVPARLRPVYRDRDELRAGADLASPIRQALAETRWLIVVCSPAASRSAWVRDEIVQFKRLHGAEGDRRVLAVIASGEPFASAQPGREAEECLPLPLRFALDAQGEPCGAALEPVAADLREHGDGRQRATLKLVAGMLDVGFDELQRRDLRRRLRWVSAIALGSSGGMVVLAALAWVATQARDEAREQRAEAESLIEFMLGDLRKKLEPVGRLDVLDAVGVKALAHYDAQDLARLDATSLGRRARAQHLIGEIHEMRGKLDEALGSFRSAAETTAAALARAPRDGQRLFDHAQSVYWVGYVAFRRGDVQAAEAAFTEYLALARRLGQVDVGRPEWQLESAYAHHNLGVVRLSRGQPAQALHEFEATQAVYRGLIASRPNLAPELADTLGWVSKAKAALGDFDGAIEALQSRVAAVQATPDADRDRIVQRDLADTAYQIAGLHLDLGRTPAAHAFARQAVEMGEALVALDATNSMWTKQLCDYRLRLALIEFEGGRPGAARELLGRVAREVQRLIDGDSSVVAWRVDVRGESLLLDARIDRSEGRRVAVGALQDYVSQAGAVEASDMLLDIRRPVIVARAEIELGDAYAAGVDAERADRYWRAAADRLHPLAIDTRFEAMAVLAAAEVRLGRRDEASRLARQLLASKYRHPAHAALINQATRSAGASPVKLSRQE